MATYNPSNVRIRFDPGNPGATNLGPTSSNPGSTEKWNALGSYGKFTGYLGGGLAVLLIIGAVVWWYNRHKLIKRLKDPSYLPSYIETIQLRGRRAPVRVPDEELVPPPSYDVEAARDHQDHVPQWMLDEMEGGADSCCATPRQALRNEEGDEAGPSGTAVTDGGVAGGSQDGVEEAGQVQMEDVEDESKEAVRAAPNDLGNAELVEDETQSSSPISIVVTSHDEGEGGSSILVHHGQEEGKGKQSATSDDWGPPPSYA
ncbi:hypothetical protein HDV00_004398 [Rhizophlyctis rosea]|nr:hypothetical protein HDV00_004398 [Rhizophlyctis rosea]